MENSTYSIPGFNEPVSSLTHIVGAGVYHMISDNEKAGLVLRRLDHASIFVLIIGTMTPIHRMLFTRFRGG